MDTSILFDTKANFENQLKEIETKITSVSSELEKLREYKLKLLGGLETLELITKEQEEPTEEN